MRLPPLFLLFPLFGCLLVASLQAQEADGKSQIPAPAAVGLASLDLPLPWSLVSDNVFADGGTICLTFQGKGGQRLVMCVDGRESQRGSVWIDAGHPSHAQARRIPDGSPALPELLQHLAVVLADPALAQQSKSSVEKFMAMANARIALVQAASAGGPLTAERATKRALETMRGLGLDQGMTYRNITVHDRGETVLVVFHAVRFASTTAADPENNALVTIDTAMQQMIVMRFETTDRLPPLESEILPTAP
jgi:hypothetical protein